MRLYPKSSEDWGRFFFFSFRTFVLVGLAFELLLARQWPKHGQEGDIPCMFFIAFGYMFCFLMFVCASFFQLIDRKIRDAMLNLLFAGITFVALSYSLRFLAVA